MRNILHVTKVVSASGSSITSIQLEQLVYIFALDICTLDWFSSTPTNHPGNHANQPYIILFASLFVFCLCLFLNSPWIMA